jgi:hypothetical protein
MSRGFVTRTTTVVSDSDALWLHGPSTPGESGGPIVNESGEILGTLTASTSDGFTMCSSQSIALQVCQRYCPNGQCQQQWQSVQQPARPPVYQTQPIPVRPQPVAPPTVVQGTAGPPGPQGPTGPPGKDATGGSCDCDDRWAVINGQIAALQGDMKASATAVSNLTNIASQPAKPAAPFHIRVRNPASGFVTAYSDVLPGQYVTIDMQPVSVEK